MLRVLYRLSMVTAILLAAGVAHADDVARGRRFALNHCSTCHAIGHTGLSPYSHAPPFRTLQTKYNVEGLAEALAEGISVGHSGTRQMPEFVLSPPEIDDFLAYLKSLEAAPKNIPRKLLK